jgi:hypothetical protein
MNSSQARSVGRLAEAIATTPGAGYTCSGRGYVAVDELATGGLSVPVLTLNVTDPVSATPAAEQGEGDSVNYPARQRDNDGQSVAAAGRGVAATRLRC